jgi:hypothetical protein
VKRGTAFAIGGTTLGVVGLLFAVGTSGRGADRAAPASPPTSAVVVTVPAPQGTVPVVITIPPTTEPTAPPPDDTDGGADDGLNPLGGNDPEDDLMPDVRCMDLQAAQDEIQDHGVFYSRSRDASGEGRRQLWDRNWVVVDQSPAPGQPIGEGDAVLYVLKDDEATDC